MWKSINMKCENMIREEEAGGKLSMFEKQKQRVQTGNRMLFFNHPVATLNMARKNFPEILYYIHIHVHLSPEESECRLNQEELHPWSQKKVSVKDKFDRNKANGGFRTQAASAKHREKRMREMALPSTFSLQLSSTSVLMRPSHPSENHAGSLQHTHTDTK